MLLLLWVACVRYVAHDGQIVDSQLHFELLRVDCLLFSRFAARLVLTRCHVMRGIWLLLSLVTHHLDEVLRGRVVHADVQCCLLDRYILLLHSLIQILALFIVENFVLALRVSFARGKVNTACIIL